MVVLETDAHDLLIAEDAACEDVAVVTDGQPVDSVPIEISVDDQPCMKQQ